MCVVRSEPEFNLTGSSDDAGTPTEGSCGEGVVRNAEVPTGKSRDQYDLSGGVKVK